MSVAGWTGALLEWEGELAALKARLSPVFRRRELKETARVCICSPERARIKD